jgi:hypothetical protein
VVKGDGEGAETGRRSDEEGKVMQTQTQKAKAEALGRKAKVCPSSAPSMQKLLRPVPYPC